MAKLNRAVFRYIEHELYSYDMIKAELRLAEQEIIEGQYYKEVAVSGGMIPDPTGTKIARLSALREGRMAATIRAIDRALQRLDETHQQVFYLKYRQCLSWQEVCDTIPISQSLYFKKRRELVQMTAQQLGLINPS